MDVHGGSDTSDRTLGDLFTELSRQASQLVRHEIRLAQAELKWRGRTAARYVAFVAGGALLAYAGVIALVFAAIWALDILLPLWAAALIVGVLVVIAGAAAAYYGITELQRMSLAPRQTVDSMKENARWARREIA
jgi:uncharacterized membrane protein YqjE